MIPPNARRLCPTHITWNLFLIPRITFVQWFAILLTKPAILGLKIFLPVMLRLVSDVFAHRSNHLS
jgi:hypothetical protein